MQVAKSSIGCVKVVSKGSHSEMAVDAETGVTEEVTLLLLHDTGYSLAFGAGSIRRLVDHWADIEVESKVTETSENDNLLVWHKRTCLRLTDDELVVLDHHILPTLLDAWHIKIAQIDKLNAVLVVGSHIAWQTVKDEHISASYSAHGGIRSSFLQGFHR